MVTARAAALRALVAVERGRGERLRPLLAAAGLPPRELAFANDLAHGVMRRERLLDHALAGLAFRGLPKDAALRCALRLGAYQLTFAGGVPAHAAVHETVALVRDNRGFANALLRRLAGCVTARAVDPAAVANEIALSPTRTLVLPEPLPADEVERLAIVHSLPDFAARRWAERFGIEGLRAIGDAASTVPGVYLRVAADLDPAALRAALAAEGVATEPAVHPRLLAWTGGNTPFATEPFRRGQFVVQDATALAAAEAVPCRPGDTVVDLCAAPGTKTTVLAERVRPGGTVFAFDPDPDRRARITENVARLRLGDTVRVVAETAGLPAADAVLADVPCSNTGVLGRRVEVRRRLVPSTATAMAAVQRDLLRQAIVLCRPGGTVVYSTCSIESEENGDVVAAVLADAAVPRCRLVASRATLPTAGQHDGGYFAVLRRALPDGRFAD